jgi:transcriptional regulator with XRE-family HTH domain
LSELGREVRRLREAHGWSQNQLSVYAGLSQPTVNQIETGKRNPSTATVVKLATALGVGVSDLFPKAYAPSPELPFEGLEDERRTPSLQSWILLVETLNESWGLEIERHAQEISGAKGEVRRLKRLIGATLATTIHEVYGAILESILQDPQFPDAYGAGEHAHLWRALRGMKELLNQTDSWFERGAQVADIRQARRERVERLERELGAYAS